MFRCIYSLAEQQGSDGEHILQNFLGARWTSNNIVCDKLQISFGQGIDLALEAGLRPIRNLLGTESGRGGVGPTLKGLVTSSGETIDMQPGGKPRFSAPLISEEQISPTQVRLGIKVGNDHQLDWALAKIRDKYPNAQIDEDEIRTSASITEGYIDGVVNLPLSIGKDEYFRGLLKSCFNLLAANYPETVYQSCFDPVREFIRDGVGRSADFVRWPVSSEPHTFQKIGKLDHHLVIVSRGRSVEGVAQLFGYISHPFRLASSYDGPPLHCAYIVDPFREYDPAELKAPVFLDEDVPNFEDQKSRDTPGVMEAFSTRIGGIMTAYSERSRERMVQRTVEEALAEEISGIITEATVEKLVDLLTHRALRIERNLGKPK